jgi:hypothetical protein
MDLLPVEYAVLLTQKSDIDRGEQLLTQKSDIDRGFASVNI